MQYAQVHGPPPRSWLPHLFGEPTARGGD